MTFKNDFSFEKRSLESERIKTKHPDRIPVICQKAEHCTNINEIDKKKYLVPKTLTMGQFVYVIRKRLLLKPEHAIFMFIGDVLPQSSITMDLLYKQYKDQDGFLYIKYSGENTFGLHNI